MAVREVYRGRGGACTGIPPAHVSFYFPPPPPYTPELCPNRNLNLYMNEHVKQSIRDILGIFFHLRYFPPMYVHPWLLYNILGELLGETQAVSEKFYCFNVIYGLNLRVIACSVFVLQELLKHAQKL